MDEIGTALAGVQVKLLELAKDIQDQAPTEVLLQKVVAALEAARVAQEIAREAKE